VAQNDVEAQIPEKIRQFESKQGEKHTGPAVGFEYRPTVMGLPNLPDGVVDLILQYGPWLVLLGAVVSAVGALGTLVQATGADALPELRQQVWPALLGLVAAAVNIAAFMGLRDRQRLGWNLAALGFVLETMAQLWIAGGANILYSGIELLLTAYVFLQVRDRFNG
jgi:hypothetical protein